MRDRDGERLGLYRCRGRHAAGKCGSPASALARVLDPLVEAAFLEALGPEGPLAEASASTVDVEKRWSWSMMPSASWSPTATRRES